MYSAAALATPLSPSQSGAVAFTSSHYSDYPQSRDDRERIEKDKRTTQLVRVRAVIAQRG